MPTVQPKHILITGSPGIGKTTLVKRLFEEAAVLHPVGFYTEEIREGGIRRGFRLVSHDGRESILSHVDIRSPYKVGKYKVDVSGFDRFLDTLRILKSDSGLVIIDEIGKMECFSRKFLSLLNELLHSETRLFATISQKGSGSIAEIKQRQDAKLFVMTHHNRDTMIAQILEDL